MDLREIGCKNGSCMDVLLRSSAMAGFGIANAEPSMSTIRVNLCDLRYRKVCLVHVWVTPHFIHVGIL
jgi:hypothetical protein